MRRVTAAFLVLALSGAIVFPVSASPARDGSDGRIISRLLTWLSGIFEKEGSQQDPWGSPGQASHPPFRGVFDSRH